MEHWGYHHHNRKKKEKRLSYITPRWRLLSFLLAAWLAAWSLLLTSSVRVATLAMQPRLVELWKCRVQHLRKYYCDKKHKQRGTSRPVYSSQFYYIPFLFMLWLMMVGSTVLLAGNLDTVMSTIGKLATRGMYCIMGRT